MRVMIEQWRFFSLLAAACVLVLFGRTSPSAAANDDLIPLPTHETSFRIEIDHDGIYELSYADLRLVGLASNVDPAKLQLLHRGKPVAHQFVGDGDNRFEAGESLRFYGWAFDGPRHEKRYVTNNVFWLITSGSAENIATLPNGSGYTPIQTAPASVTYEEDLIFTTTHLYEWSAYPNEPDEWYSERYDYYFHGETVSFDNDNDGETDKQTFFPAPTYNIVLPHPAASSQPATFTAEFTTAYKGSTMLTVTVGTGSASETWADARNLNVVGSVPNSALLDGTNVVTVAGQTFNEDGTQYETTPNGRVWFNRVTVDYVRDLIADADQLLFNSTQAGAFAYQVRGFTTDDAAAALVWQIGDRYAPVAIQLTAGDMLPFAGGYQWQIAVDHGSDARFMATTMANIGRPAALAAYVAPPLDPATNGANWLAITHPDFRAEIDQLAAYRAAMSDATNGVIAFQTHVVNVDDVINQYGYGLPTPGGIQAYLRHAVLDWAVPPQYVVLGGDADWTPKGIPSESEPFRNFIPVDLQFTNPETGMIMTDYTYATLVGDDLKAEFAIGRLPAETAAEMANMVEKITRYETQMLTHTNANRVLLPSDDFDLGGDFCTGNKELKNLYIPGSYDVVELCVDDYDAQYAGEENGSYYAKLAWRDDFFETINSTQGVDLLNYRGHGSVQYWASAHLRTDHSDRFENDVHPTVFVSHDCLDASFGRDGLQSLGETFLKQAITGSAAHLGSTGLSYNWQHTITQRGFYAALYDDAGTHTRIGDAADAGARAYLEFRPTDPFVYETALLGDPAMLLVPDARVSPTLLPELAAKLPVVLLPRVLLPIVMHY